MDRFVRYDLHTKLNHCGGFLFGGNVFFFIVCFLNSFNYTDPFCLALFYFRQGSLTYLFGYKVLPEKLPLKFF